MRSHLYDDPPTTRSGHARRCLLVATACLAAACGGEEPQGPPGEDPDGLGLLVGIEADPARFRSTGEFAISLVPHTAEGERLTGETWSVSLALEAPAGASLAMLSQARRPADTMPAATLLLIDNSGSMRFSDPDRYRAQAAQLFWTEVLGGRPGNLVALADFGGGEPTDEFEHSRLLHGFTSDPAALAAQIDRIQAVGGFGTPLHGSALELMRWMDERVPGSGYRRSIVLMTDGEPGDGGAAREALVAQSRAAGIPLITVGLGAASSDGARTSEVAVGLLVDLASATGGVYAGASTDSRLRPVLQALGRESTQEQLLATVRISPVPAAGVVLRGRVVLDGVPGSVEGRWALVGP
jgi:Mg-chelatase subunit ChlD